MSLMLSLASKHTVTGSRMFTFVGNRPANGLLILGSTYLAQNDACLTGVLR